jgi:hypothetical protein
MSTKAIYEYRVETFGSALSSIKDEDLESTLNHWAGEGWEVINAHPVGDNKVRVICRRTVSKSATRKRGWP